jgi:hypothetical protein
LVNLAERYNWSPQLVLEMDPDFLGELEVRLRAEADHEAHQRRRRRAQAAARQREASRQAGGWVVEEASIAEIE